MVEVQERKLKIDEFEIPIIEYKCALILFTDPLALVAQFPEHRFETDPRDIAGGVFEIDGVAYLAIEESELTHGIIAHETKHLLNRAFVWIGYKPDPDNDELECYFLQWLTSTIYGLIDREKILDDVAF